MREIDFTLVPTPEEAQKLVNKLPMKPVIDISIDAIKTGSAQLKAWGHPVKNFTFYDVWACNTVFAAGYVLGVRNERKRRREAGR